MSTWKIFTPSVFTLLNFFWGFLAIIEAIGGNIHTAAWFIIIAVLCDGMDGKLARWTHAESTFGFELDSLADLISSGVAPAILVYQGVLFNVRFVGIFICFLYVFTGGYRLARFNTIQKGDRQEGYFGLPIPVAGLTVASLWLFDYHFNKSIEIGSWIVLLLFINFMMISAIPYDWPKIDFRGRWFRKLQSSMLIILVILMALFPHRTLFPSMLLYIGLGIKNWIFSLSKGRVRWTEFFLPLKKN